MSKQFRDATTQQVHPCEHLLTTSATLFDRKKLLPCHHPPRVPRQNPTTHSGQFPKIHTVAPILLFCVVEAFAMLYQQQNDANYLSLTAEEMWEGDR
jgi:hypothetical protein